MITLFAGWQVVWMFLAVVGGVALAVCFVFVVVLWAVSKFHSPCGSEPRE